MLLSSPRPLYLSFVGSPPPRNVRVHLHRVYHNSGNCLAILPHDETQSIFAIFCAPLSRRRDTYLTQAPRLAVSGTRISTGGGFPMEILGLMLKNTESTEEILVANVWSKGAAILDSAPAMLDKMNELTPVLRHIASNRIVFCLAWMDVLCYLGGTIAWSRLRNRPTILEEYSSTTNLLDQHIFPRADFSYSTADRITPYGKVDEFILRRERCWVPAM
jgi:hypothetical protein